MEDILQKYFNLKSPAFKKNGRFTKAGGEAYNKLINLISDIVYLGVNGIDEGILIDELDKIEHEDN